MTSDALENVTPLSAEELVSLYLAAKEQIIAEGFADEVDWQESVASKRWTESTFLSESAWVVLSAGFREAVLRRRFGEVSKAFLDWKSAALIVANRDTCLAHALNAFGNRRKMDAIVRIVDRVADEGIEAIRRHVEDRGTEFLQELPYVGPVTACHLAKNLGIVMVKPDRHLTRLAAKVGCESPLDMCRSISECVGDSLSVIDVVLWRYSTMRADRLLERGCPDRC